MLPSFPSSLLLHSCFLPSFPSHSSSNDSPCWTSSPVSSHTGRGGAHSGHLREVRLWNGPHPSSFDLGHHALGSWYHAKWQNARLALFCELSDPGFLGWAGSDVELSWLNIPLMCNMIHAARCCSRTPCFENHLKWLKLSKNIGLEHKAGTFCGLVFTFISSCSLHPAAA